MSTANILAAMRGQYTETTAAGHCATHGDFVIRRFIDAAGNLAGEVSRCGKCLEEARDAGSKVNRDEALKARFRDAEVPTRFRACTFSNFDPIRAGSESFAASGVADEIRTYSRQFAAHLKTGKSVALIGTPGTGKTHLAVSALKVAVLLGFTARYSTVADMVASVRGTWDSDSTLSEAAVRASYSTPDLLVLDEVGAGQSGTEAEIGLLTGVIDRRYRELRPTMFVGNVDVPELRRYLGDRVLSRLMDQGGRVFTFNWQDHRVNRSGS